MTTAPGKTQVNPVVILEVGDVQLKFNFNLRAIVDLFTETGVNILEQGISPEKLASIDFMTAMMVHGLKAHQPNITKDWLLDNITVPQLGEVINALMEATSVVMPKKIREQVEAAAKTDPPVPPTSS